MVNLAVISARIAQRGLIETAREAWHILRAPFVPVDAFDRNLGTDTTRTRRLWGLEIKSANLIEGVLYQTIDPVFIEITLRSLSIHFQNFTFLDLGCGKGRPLLVAAKLGFGRVLGIDFSSELCAIARNNLRVARLTGDVSCADACDVQFPDDPLVVYLFNPFGAKVMQCVCQNLDVSLREKPRRCFVVYVNPVHATVFDGTGFKRCGGSESVVIYDHPAQASGESKG